MLKIATLEDFKKVQGMSYSRLSNLADSPQAYRSALAEDITSSAIDLGSLVDVLLTEPDNFDKEFYVMTTPKPSSPMMINFCEHYAISKNQEEALAYSGFKLGLPAVMNKFEKEGRAYYDAFKASIGRRIVDVNQMMTANQIIKQLKENQFTKKYFIPEEGVELLFQVPIIWNVGIDVNGKMVIIDIKSLLDIIRIDHNNKTIEPVDLKTGAEPFYKGFFKYKRYLQGAMYTDATMFALGHSDTEKYEVQTLKFIYADTNLYRPPMIYKMTRNDLEVGRHGRKYNIYSNTHPSNIMFNSSNEYKYKGYTQLIKELLWHQENDLWDYSYDVYQNNGEVDIDAFTVKL